MTFANSSTLGDRLMLQHPQHWYRSDRRTWLFLIGTAPSHFLPLRRRQAVVRDTGASAGFCGRPRFPMGFGGGTQRCARPTRSRSLPHCGHGSMHRSYHSPARCFKIRFNYPHLFQNPRRWPDHWPGALTDARWSAAAASLSRTRLSAARVPRASSPAPRD
jgi:hypothetical protein